MSLPCGQIFYKIQTSSSESRTTSSSSMSGNEDSMYARVVTIQRCMLSTPCSILLLTPFLPILRHSFAPFFSTYLFETFNFCGHCSCPLHGFAEEFSTFLLFHHPQQTTDHPNLACRVIGTDQGGMEMYVHFAVCFFSVSTVRYYHNPCSLTGKEFYLLQHSSHCERSVTSLSAMSVFGHVCLV